MEIRLNYYLSRESQWYIFKHKSYLFNSFFLQSACLCVFDCLLVLVGPILQLPLLVLKRVFNSLISFLSLMFKWSLIFVELSLYVLFLQMCSQYFRLYSVTTLFTIKITMNFILGIHQRQKKM